MSILYNRKKEQKVKEETDILLDPPILLGTVELCYFSSPWQQNHTIEFALTFSAQGDGEKQ